MIERFIVSRDDNIYEAWPDLTLTPSGKMVCIFSECTHHKDRDYTRIMLTDSLDRGRTWSPKRPLTDACYRKSPSDHYWNCGRVTTLSDGRLAAVCDLPVKDGLEGEQLNYIWHSSDEGATWDGPHLIPIIGIVPDKLVELKHGKYAGRWMLNAHVVTGEDWWERCWYSDDKGKTWSGPFVMAHEPGLKLCEGSILEVPSGELICFMRENSGQGLDCFKSISKDGGETWEGVYKFPLPACHRPVAGMLQSGKVLITHRFLQGGASGWGKFQNFFAALTDVESCLATTRKEARTRIMPIDFDRNPMSDTGYSGWVQFPDGEIYMVNYIMDDAPKGHIRGYSLRERDFILPE